MYQNDFADEIEEYGCLWFSLMNVAEEMCGEKLNVKQILNMYDHLRDRNYMTKDCYVLNHAEVINEALSFMLHPEIRAEYIGSQYLDKPKESWGKSEGDFVILQVKTEFVAGHFIRPKYNPYFPASRVLSLRSARYYKEK